ncbi:MAG: galactokinase [Candidatus Omnitrophica bacterium]|nr:galactokinase [Candidatus Omnitrophota bacterium]MCM8769059.1 galactokinase [Candidatus Omnitrophota bacterium]
MRQTIKQEFVRLFGESKEMKYKAAPGRTNLIGEHVDYQGGYVLPIAINRFIGAWAKKRGDSWLRFYSLTYRQSYQGDLSCLRYVKEFPWANYILGVATELKKSGILSFGFDLAVGGNVPVASGLSSSAALEICVASLLLDLAEVQMEPVELIKLARRAENEFVGVNCGIMDQFSSYLCRKRHALLLNCTTLRYQQVPLSLGDYTFLLVNTLKERGLLSSAYNQRVAEVNQALRVVQKRWPEITYLAELKEEQLMDFKASMEETIFRRAWHVVRENQRVIDSVRYLKAGKILEFGQLLYASHESLKDYYQVSCPELDFIVEFSRNYSGVAGARLTGGGFGGCCLVLLRKEVVGDFKETLQAAYQKNFQRQPDFLLVETADGAYYSRNDQVSCEKEESCPS